MFRSLVSTGCGMFVCSVVYPCQLFCSAWMFCLEVVYRCLHSDVFSVVNLYLDRLMFCTVCMY